MYTTDSYLLRACIYVSVHAHLLTNSLADDVHQMPPTFLYTYNQGPRSIQTQDSLVVGPL